jgi:hypothetical protein
MLPNVTRLAALLLVMHLLHVSERFGPRDDDPLFVSKAILVIVLFVILLAHYKRETKR